MNKENIIDYVLQTPHNPNKKVLDDMLETLIEENGGGNTSVSEQIAEAIAKIPQADWNQHDETAKDYIKNRPFYEESKDYTILENQQLRDTGDDFFFEGIVPYGFTIGDTVNVKFSGDDEGDDVIYTAVAVPYDFRNNAAQLPEYKYSDYEHCDVYCWEDNGEIWVEARSFSHTSVTITVSNETIKHIDPKYIKDMYYESEPVKTVLVNNLTFEDYDNGNYPACNFIPGQKYKVIWNGEVYDNLVCYFDGEFNIIASERLGCPFYIDDDGGDELYIESDNEDEAWVVSIIADLTEIHHIDPKYIPDSIARVPSDEEVVELLTETGIADPAVNSEGAVYTDNNGNLYTL